MYTFFSQAHEWTERLCKTFAFAVKSTSDMNRLHAQMMYAFLQCGSCPQTIQRYCYDSRGARSTSRVPYQRDDTDGMPSLLVSWSCQELCNLSLGWISIHHPSRATTSIHSGWPCWTKSVSLQRPHRTVRCLIVMRRIASKPWLVRRTEQSDCRVTGLQLPRAARFDQE